MQYQIAYGRGQLAVELPEKNVVKVFNPHLVPIIEDPMDAVFDVLEMPAEAEPLADIASGKKSACVVVADMTCPVPNAFVLPPILQTLEDAGIDQQRITILTGTGLHRSSTSEERHESLGEDIMAKRYKITDHSAAKIHQHEYLGVTKSGIPIWVDRRYLEADVKVLTGAIEPHLITGFTGGRHSICPAIAATETICACYALAFLEHENTRCGCLEGNPVHAEQMEIARKAGCDFLVNAVLDKERRIVKIVGGAMNPSFQKGLAFARKTRTDSIKEPADIVITSGAGSPKDKTFYQAIKGIAAAVEAVKPGGTIILAAECSEGFGSAEFTALGGKFEQPELFIEAVKSGAYAGIDQWQFAELLMSLRRAKVKVVSKLPAEELQKFFVEPCATVEAAVADALKEHGESATIAVIPYGQCVLVEAQNPLPTPAEYPKLTVKKTVEKVVDEKAAEKAVEKKPESKPEPKPEPVKESTESAEPKQAAAEPQKESPEPKKKAAGKKAVKAAVKTDADEEKPPKKAAKKAAVKKVEVKKAEKAEPKKAAKKTAKKAE